MLGCFTLLQTQLDKVSALHLRSQLHRFPEIRRYVKLNHLGHNNLFDHIPSAGRLPPAFKFQQTYQIHPHRQRTESHNRSLCKSALQTAHDLIHMVLPEGACGNKVVPVLPTLSTSAHRSSTLPSPLRSYPAPQYRLPRAVPSRVLPSPTYPPSLPTQPPLTPQPS